MIRDLHFKLIKKEISAVELLQDYLARVRQSDLNAFVTLTEEEAMKQAKQVDEKLARGDKLSVLAGVPASVKDVILTQGVRTTAASKVLENYIAPYDATVISKLKERGLVMLGKNNCDEFAMGSSNENSAFGAVKNPYDKERVPGGSSGGSAAAVAAGLSVYALGSDTGGSVRQPAAFCGVVGLKPTYGAVSRYGLIAMASSLDQVGVLASCVGDARIVFEAIKGSDKLDSTSVETQNQVSRLGDKTQDLDNLQNIKIGVPKEYFVAGIDGGVRAAVERVIDRVQELGAEIVEVSLPHTEYALAVYYIIMPAEVSANLARYDGIRYGQSFAHRLTQTGTQTNADETDLLSVYKKTRAEFLGQEVKRRIMLGTYVLSAGYYEAYYKKAQQVRALIRQDFEKIFFNDKIDLLITPTTPTPAFKLGEKITHPLQMYLEDVFTVPVNVAGLPALSISVGKTKSGLPIGGQLIGPWLAEDLILGVGEILETEL